ncbi:MAG: regulatory protein GemA [Comamonas sp.]
MKPQTAAEIKARQMRIIQVGKSFLAQQCGMTLREYDEDYRRILRDQFHVSSSTELDMAGRDKLITWMKARGFVVKRGPQGREAQNRPLAQDLQARKARALWLMLHELGQVHDPSEQALADFVRRQAKVDALQWARHGMLAVIEALKAWALRGGLPEAVERGLAELEPAALRELPWQLLQDLTAQQLALKDARAAGAKVLFDPYWALYDTLAAVRSTLDARQAQAAPAAEEA